MKADIGRRKAISILIALCTSVGLSVGQTYAADKYPVKPVTIIVPFPAGGGTDLAIRSLQPKLQARLGVPIIVENRPGAGGTIGTSAGAKAAPDGYTLVAVTTTTIASAKAVYPQISYDPVKDFVPIGSIGLTPFVLVVAPNLPVKSFDEFLQYAKAQGGTLNYASVGNGSASHLVGEWFKRRTGVAMTHVPYRGATPAQMDLMAGHVQVLFDNPTALVQYVRAGKMKALAISDTSPILPGVASFESLGLRDFRPELWYGIMAPAGTPQPVVTQLQTAFAAAVEDSSVKADLQARGITPLNMSPSVFASRISRDTVFWTEIAKSVDARAE
jgi:tripartite-type tricarboxylate transporter receptor subunit TctC